ncbi:hypothetical protein [Pseudoalteromonas luteoviolacea]|uniref:hypothetical protein n=1 Tax=Pseudoalteromonas luteoviolacea TaxID=43657 RepID=UPI001B361C35|nr:hypothetical protein [Pseudoalteromonas luteoviolacea]MBQ4834868.1 hypothetical protein [Pseudoalteromonas luteoviolacea]
MNRVLPLIFSFILASCSSEEYSVVEAASDACNFRLSQNVIEIERQIKAIEEISIQGGVYIEQGVLKISPQEFQSLRESLESNMFYSSEEGELEIKYLRENIKIDRCYGSCGLAKKGAIVSYSLECS